ncbi:MAG: FixH family protein [Chitinophagia bacterium]|jgi:FixH
MKINWGYRIFIVYALFVIGILVLSYKSSQQKFDLVQQDYYGAELKYQTVIDAASRANALRGELKLTLKESKLLIQLPAQLGKGEVLGEVNLYCTYDEKRDLTKKVATTNGQMEIELLTTTKGNYTLKLAVEQKGISYYFEKKVII